MAFVDFYQGSEAPRQFLDDIIVFLKHAVHMRSAEAAEPSPAINRWIGFLDNVSEMSRGWGNLNEVKGKKDIRIHAILTGPDRLDALEQVMALWPDGAAPINAYVTSPFLILLEWSIGHPVSCGKAQRQQGKVSVIFNLTAVVDPTENIIVLNAPIELLDAERIEN